MTLIHMPALLEGEFELSRSEAVRLLAQGRVKANGKTVRGIDVDLEQLLDEDDECVVTLTRSHADTVAQILGFTQPSSSS